MRFDWYLTIEKELSDITNWRPNYTKISKKTGIAVSTLHDHYNRAKKIHNRNLKQNLMKK